MTKDEINTYMKKYYNLKPYDVVKYLEDPYNLTWEITHFFLKADHRNGDVVKIFANLEGPYGARLIGRPTKFVKIRFDKSE